MPQRPHRRRSALGLLDAADDGKASRPRTGSSHAGERRGVHPGMVHGEPLGVHAGTQLGQDPVACVRRVAGPARHRARVPALLARMRIDRRPVQRPAVVDESELRQAAGADQRQRQPAHRHPHHGVGLQRLQRLPQHPQVVTRQARSLQAGRTPPAPVLPEPAQLAPDALERQAPARRSSGRARRPRGPVARRRAHARRARSPLLLSRDSGCRPSGHASPPSLRAHAGALPPPDGAT